MISMKEAMEIKFVRDRAVLGHDKDIERERERGVAE